LYNVCEGDVMVIPSDQLNQRSEEPGSIRNEVVAAPVVPQAIDVAPDIPQGNVVEPGIDEADDVHGIHWCAC
jgi:hypothetical protein